MTHLKKQISSLFLHPVAFIVLGLSLCLLALLSLFYAQKNLNQLHEQALYLKQKQHWVKKRHSKEQKLFNQMKAADPDYIEKQVQSLVFLASEIQKLQTLNTENPRYEMRLKTLTSQNNRLMFKEQNFQNLNNLREVELIQKYPVELNQKDLETLLARLESAKPPFNPPQLLIKKFDLQKKQSPTNEETFLVQLEILKREIAHE